MNQNNITEQLENKPEDVQTRGDTEVSVGLKAVRGASINAPVITGNVFKGTVHISCSLNPAEHSTPTNINKGSAAEYSKAAYHDYRNISLRLKNKLQQEYKSGHLKLLTEIKTDLYVVENVTGGMVCEHDEVMRIEAANQFAETDTLIQCNDIFKSQRDTGEQNRIVLTMGISGVGKTISVNKLILDWAEGRENQDILFIFPLPFRRLNIIKTKYSLMGLLNKCFFSGPEELPSLPEDDGKVMFIFDGLDECHFPFSFKKGDRITDVHKKTTVSKIVTNLIEEYIDQVTEVRGFNDEQKEQYFIKNSSPEVAGNIIRHIRKSRSLYIMCHIPVFCWISLTVLQHLLARESNDKTPTTLTEMYTNFLLCQNQQMERKYNPELKSKVKSFDQIVLKLGKLAFQQLQKGNLIFYKEDLEKCGLDVSEGSVLSVLCTQIFQMESSLSERKVYSFIHLSMQEFLAAFYVFFKYKCYGRNAFLQFEREKFTLKRSKASLFDLHKAGIDKALQSKNGHLDLFLRFLLGLSLESSQSDLKELLPQLELKPENLKGTADYIKKTIEKENSVEMIINLLYCLVEMKDDFAEDIQKNLSSGNLSAQRLSSAQRSALEFIRLMSEAQRSPVSTRRPSVDHGGDRMTAGLRNYAFDLTLDPNTTYIRLCLYEDNRKVKHVKKCQSYPDHPDRFEDYEQVLCVESLTGRCYWETEWSGWVNIAVTYKGISRKTGSDCQLGFNDKSWSLWCTDNGFAVWHNNVRTDLPAPSLRSDRVGVYVDVSAGSLSFYSVSDTHTLTHLHTFNTTFTEPLCAGFRVYYASSVSLCQITTPTSQP
uniref:Uncharacterized protein n=1 Tax=Cyprinus carpio TaxID=7962 RepID=A0A8C1NF06_CYPCA